MVVNEVITLFSFRGSAAPLHDYNDTLGKSIGLLAGVAAAFVATAGAVAGFTISTAKANDPMIQLSRTTGVTVETLQELGYAASVNGSSFDAMASSVAGLTDRIGEAAQKGSEDFARLGISVRDINGDVKSADQVLQEINASFNRMDLSLSERRSFAASLGIDPSLIQLLSLTGSELDAVREKARQMGTITTEQADAMVRLTDAVTTLKFGLNAVKNELAVRLAPVVEDATAGFTDFLAANKELITDGITAVMEITTALGGAVVRLTPIIATITGGFLAWKAASIGVAGVMGVILSPVILTTAAITAAVLVIDDLIVALDGGKSVIADFAQEFLGIDIVPPLQAAVEGVKELVGELLAAAANVASTFAQLFGAAFALITGDFDRAGDLFSGFVSDVTGYFKAGAANIIQLFSDLGGMIVDAVDLPDLSAGLVDPIKSAFTALFDWLTAGFTMVSDKIGGVLDFFGFGQPEAPPAQTTSATEPADDLPPRNTWAPEPESVDRPVTVRDVINAQAKKVGRDVTVVDELEVVNAKIPGAQPLNRETLDRPVTVRESLALERGELPPFVPPQPENVARPVNMQDVIQYREAQQPAAPMITPISIDRVITVLDSVDNIGELLPGELPDLTQRIGFDVDQFPQFNDERLNMTLDAVNQQRVLPQPTTNNSQSRTVTIEQNNQFDVRGAGPEQIGRRIVDDLQQQLDDAKTQLSVGGY